MKLKDSLKDLTHHAYCLVGGDSIYLELIDILESDMKFIIKGNPDFFHEKYETLGIDESRGIKELHVSKSFATGSKRIFIIETKGMTHEAQNSLLKIFEEPHEYTYFFLIVPSAAFLLPTLNSRLSIIKTTEEEKDLKRAKKFLILSTKDKIAFVDDIAKRISDEEIEKSYAVEFLAELEQAIHEKGIEKNMRAVKAIFKARDYMSDRSPSVKQLLEFVALSI